MKILQDIISTIKKDAPVREVRVGPFWTAVRSRYCGLSSTFFDHNHEAGPPVKEAGSLTEKSALELCQYAFSDSLLERSIGLAAINSILEVDIENNCLQRVNASELLLNYGKDKRVSIVGHFPFIPRLKEKAAKLWVLEKHPRSGDLPSIEAENVIPQSDLVAITGTALLNGTMESLLALCRKDALVMVLGPTTPKSPVWYRYGVKLISGTIVTEPDTVLKYVSQGIIFSQFKGRGVKLVTMADSAVRNLTAELIKQKVSLSKGQVKCFSLLKKAKSSI
ncbi:MAG: DUF364 domain-containing protein [Firmicutes bacterium]|nr:DUF364 domain-containing protein [Bacillota bacterium]